MQGYYKKDGTYVKPHYRTAPNSTNRDNFSTKGNINPYTGEPGYISPDNKSINKGSSLGNNSGSYYSNTNNKLEKRIGSVPMSFLTSEYLNADHELSAQDYYKKARNESDYEKKTYYYLICLSLEPDYPNAHNNIGMVDYHLGRYNWALENFNKAISLDPDNFYAYNNRAVLNIAKERYDEAIDDFNMVIKLNPDYVTAYSNRGVAYHKLGRYDNAIADYTRSIRMDPDNAKVYYNARALSKEKAGYPYFNDYKKSCDLGYKEACKAKNRN